MQNKTKHNTLQKSNKKISVNNKNEKKKRPKNIKGK